MFHSVLSGYGKVIMPERLKNFPINMEAQAVSIDAGLESSICQVQN
jgi:hypothetical protein